MSSAKLSIAIPAVTMLTETSGDWEKNATIEDLGQIAQAADRLGGGWTFGSTESWNRNARGRRTDPQSITVVYLDDDPLAATAALAPLIEERWRSAAMRPMFAGPMPTMISWETWP